MTTIDEIRAKWEQFEARLSKGDGPDGSIMGAAFLIAKSGVTDVAVLCAEIDRLNAVVDAQAQSMLEIEEVLNIEIDRLTALVNIQRSVGKLNIDLTNEVGVLTARNAALEKVARAAKRHSEAWNQWMEEDDEPEGMGFVEGTIYNLRMALTDLLGESS